jgi:hypothetical protein
MVCFGIISAGLITGTTIADMKELGLEENSPRPFTTKVAQDKRLLPVR